MSSLRFFRKHIAPTSLTDEQLAERLCGTGRADAEAAFTELYGRYAPRIHAYCYRVLDVAEEAEDAFQETFLRFHSLAAGGRMMNNVCGLLFTIARNICLNQKERRGRWRAEEIDEDMFSEWDIPYESKELVELIGDALAKVGPEYREAFVLRVYDGLSFQDIAQITGASVATAKIRVFRAKEKIRKILDPYLPDSIMT